MEALVQALPREAGEEIEQTLAVVRAGCPQAQRPAVAKDHVDGPGPRRLNSRLGHRASVSLLHVFDVIVLIRIVAAAVSPHGGGRLRQLTASDRNSGLPAWSSPSLRQRDRLGRDSAARNQPGDHRV